VQRLGRWRDAPAAAVSLRRRHVALFLHRFSCSPTYLLSRTTTVGEYRASAARG
jgi:hypothetical protein